MSKEAVSVRFERDLQYVNFTFGSAFGGYVGIVLALKELSDSTVILLVALLIGVSSWLIFYHDVALDVLRRGMRARKWSFGVFFSMAIGLQLIALGLPEAGMIASRVFGGWAIVLILLLLSQRYVKKHYDF